MKLGSAELTRWSLQLADRDQEQRFREFTRRTELLTLLGNALLIVGLDVVALVIRLANHGTFAATDIAIQAVILVLLATAATLMWRARTPRTTGYLLSATVALFVVMALVIATSEGMAFGGALLLLAGVMLIYLAARFNLTIVTSLAVLYSVLVGTAWLATTPPPAPAEIVFTVAVIALAHALGFAEARRTQRERRILFAHQELLGKLSQTDELTGLINRRAFRTELDKAWSRWRKRQTPMAVVMLDLDHFKRFNDTFGHPAGDVALRLVGDAIRTCLSPANGQLGARYGGEEFMCLLPAATLPDATAVAERLRLAIGHLQLRMPRPDGATLPTLTVSGGVAVPDMSMRHVGDLLQAVDNHLYGAKTAGRDCIRPAPTAVTTDDHPDNLTSCDQRGPLSP